jgi:hypothetical protein
MTTRPTNAQVRQAERSIEQFARAASTAASFVAFGDPDELVVLGDDCPDFPGTQDDDGVRAAAAIDILRFFVAEYEDAQEALS